MPTQMKRFVMLSIANALTDALEDSTDALDSMLDAYRLANDVFRQQENDVDPATIALGLQAQALGILTLCNWLEAISSVTSGKYALRAVEARDRTQRIMESIGIVIPDIMTL